jgi:hypothetical protein
MIGIRPADMGRQVIDAHPLGDVAARVEDFEIT